MPNFLGFMQSAKAMVLLLAAAMAAFTSTISAADLVVEVRYFPQSIRAQAYEVRVDDSRMVTFTGIRNVKVQGARSFRISRDQYAAIGRLLESGQLPKSAASDPYYGYVAHVNLGVDGKARSIPIDAFTNLRDFLVFKNALEDILALRSYRCPYRLVDINPEIEVCALNEALEQKILKGE